MPVEPDRYRIVFAKLEEAIDEEGPNFVEVLRVDEEVGAESPQIDELRQIAAEIDENGLNTRLYTGT